MPEPNDSRLKDPKSISRLERLESMLLILTPTIDIVMSKVLRIWKIDASLLNFFCFMNKLVML